jgi:hypothetical protein
MCASSPLLRNSKNYLILFEKSQNPRPSTRTQLYTERFCFPAPAKYTYHGNKRERCFIVLYKCGSLRGNFNARPLMLRAALLLFWRSAVAASE